MLPIYQRVKSVFEGIKFSQPESQMNQCEFIVSTKTTPKK